MTAEIIAPRPAAEEPREDHLALLALQGRLRQLTPGEVSSRVDTVSGPPTPAASREPLLDYLIIACSPTVAPLPEAPVEAHAVAAIVERAGMRALVLHDGQLATLNDVIMQRRPRVVIFIGHADAQFAGARTLGLTDDKGQLVRMQPETVVDVLGQASDRLELLLVNGCSSEALCEPAACRFSVPTAGWRTRTADAAAKVWSIGLVERLVRDTGPLSRNAVRAAFEHGRRAVEAVVKRSGAGSRWAIADPDEQKQLADGAWAAGVPVLLAPLPPELLAASGVPELPEQYQRRPKLEAAHRVELLRTENMTITARTTGLSGAAGAGKSSTAAVLARDVHVQTHFPDGIVWLAFGRERSGAQVLRTLAERLGVVAVAHEELHPTISRALVGQRRLLVLDDIWTREQLNAFSALTAVGGLLGRLVTTRSHELAGGHNLEVTSLKEEEGLRVLASYMGANVEDVHADSAAERLVEMCCGNPAMLRSVAALCRKKKGTGPALQYLEQCRSKMRHAKLPDADTYGTLYDALAGSLAHLGAELKTWCEMLAIFPEDTQVPWCVVARLWGVDEVEAEEAITKLMDWNLIGADQERRTLSLLDLHLDYLRANAKEVDLARWHADLLHRCGRRNLGRTEEGTEDDSYWRVGTNVQHHLTGCGWAPSALGGEVMELDLGGVGIGDEGAKALAAGVAASGSLATLNLNVNNIGDEGAKALADGVAASGSLAMLNLELNNIGDEGAKALADGVAASGSLALLVVDDELAKHAELVAACKSKGVDLV